MSKYHMRRSDRAITNYDELVNILLNGKFATLALCRDNEPYIVTLSYGYDKSSNALYFHCATSGLKLQFISDNPSVCATVINDKGYLANECAHEYESLVMRGTIEVIESNPEKQHALNIILNHLECNPEPIIARNLKCEADYDRITILRLNISELSGKKGR